MCTLAAISHLKPEPKPHAPSQPSPASIPSAVQVNVMFVVSQRSDVYSPVPLLLLLLPLLKFNNLLLMVALLGGGAGMLPPPPTLRATSASSMDLALSVAW